MTDSLVNATLVQVEKLQEENQELQATIDQLQQKQGQVQKTKQLQDEIKDANSAFTKIQDLMIQKKVPINGQGTLKERLINLYNSLNDVVFKKLENESKNGIELTQTKNELSQLQQKYSEVNKQLLNKENNLEKKKELTEIYTKQREQQKQIIEQQTEEIKEQQFKIDNLSKEVAKLRSQNKKLQEEQQTQLDDFKKQSEIKDIMIDVLSCENLVAMETLGDGFKASDLVIPYLRKYHQMQQDAVFHDYCDKYFKRDIKRQCINDRNSKQNISSPKSSNIKIDIKDIPDPIQRPKDEIKKRKYQERTCIPLKPDPEVKKYVDKLKEKIKEKGSDLPLEWRKIDVTGTKEKDSNMWGWFLDGKFINLIVQNNKLMCYKGAMKVDILKYLSEYM